jgi:hypothetical protein
VQKVEAVADPPEPDHAHSQHARRGGGHVSRLQPSSWTVAGDPTARARARLASSPSGLGSAIRGKCLLIGPAQLDFTVRSLKPISEGHSFHYAGAPYKSPKIA